MKPQKVQLQAVIATGAVLLLFSLSAFGQAEGTDTAAVAEEGTNIYTASIAALTKLFVLAVLVESALSLVVVKTFDIDIVAELMKVYDPNSNPGDVMSTTLTALILAGGSSGVNKLFVALGFRSRLQEQAPQPPSTEAWIAILMHRDSGPTRFYRRFGERPEKVQGPVFPKPQPVSHQRWIQGGFE